MGKTEIFGIVWNFQNDKSDYGAWFSRPAYERINWTGIPIVLEDFKTEVGTVKKTWLCENERIWIHASLEVPNDFTFRGLGLYFKCHKNPDQTVDPDTIQVVNIALCEPLDPICSILMVSPME